MTADGPGAAAARDLAPHFDLYNPAHGEHLWDVMSYAQQACPVLKTDADDGYFIVTRYDDVRTVAEDPATFSSVEPALRGLPFSTPPVSVDPPDHLDYRRQLNPHFSRTALRRFEPSIRENARAALSGLTAGRPVEFMHDFAVPFIAANVALVVVNDDNVDRMKRATTTVSRITTEGTAQSWQDLYDVSIELLEARVRTDTRDNDVLGAVIDGTVAGRPLTRAEQAGTLVTLLTGGLDTTKAAIGNIIRHLAERPELEERLRDPEWVSEALDEFLRFETPIMFQARTVTKDTTLNNCPLKAGDRLAIHLAAANRDPERFPLPDALDFERAHNPHAAFGLGIHRCIGLHFARMQIEIALEEFLTHATNVRITPGDQVQTATGVVLTHTHLPIVFDRMKTVEQ